MRIRSRLLLGVLAIVAIFAVFAAYVFTVWESIVGDSDRMDELYESTVHDAVPTLDKALHLALVVGESRVEILDLSTGDQGALGRLERTFDRFDELYDDLAATADDGPADIGAALAAIETEHEHLREEVAGLRSGASSAGDGPAGVSDEWLERVDDEFAALEAQLEVFERRYEQDSLADTDEFDRIIHRVVDRIRRVEVIMIVVLGIAILAAFGVGYGTAQSISRPIEQLSAAATAIERGTYEVGSIDEVGRRSDELGGFARVFAAMATQVRVREGRLRDRIRALRVEIDRGRSDEQADEIAGTDFFRDLQRRARELREDPDRHVDGRAT